MENAMSKNDYIWVAIRIFGIYLLVLAIAALPAAISAFYYVATSSDAAEKVGSVTSSLNSDYRKVALTSGIKSISEALIFLVCAYYFIRHGGLIFRVASKAGA